MLPVRCFLGCFHSNTDLASSFKSCWYESPCRRRSWRKVRDGVIALISFHKTDRRKSGNYVL
jgi:hypothetical protein